MGGKLGGQVLHRQNGVAGSVVHGGEAAFQGTAHHGADQFAHVGLLGGLGHDQVTISQHRDFITDFKNLIHLVGDVDQGNALIPEHPHHLKELVHLFHRQGGGGLVQHDDLGVVGDGLGNLTHLPLGHRHVAHGLGQVYGHTQLAEQLGGLFLHDTLVHDTSLGGVSAQEQVVHDVALQALVQFLVHHGNSVFQGILGAGEVDLLAVKVNSALVFLVCTEQALHHGGFTSAVLAHQAHDGAAFQVQIDVIQHPVTAEGLAHTANRQDNIVLCFCHSRYSCFRLTGYPAGIITYKLLGRIPSAVQETSSPGRRIPSP